jgi:FKBP-type peptidyl-prolyl cis-trans isomerase SlpA
MTESKKVIGPESLVLMHYTLRLADESVADSTLDDDKPAMFQIGAGHISEAFEQQLIGMTVDEKKRVRLKPEDAFGYPIEENIYTVPSKRFDNLEKLEEGMIVGFAQPDGQEVPGVIRSVTDGLVIVDFNHPLAGQEVIFDLQIVNIDPEEVAGEA